MRGLLNAKYVYEFDKIVHEEQKNNLPVNIVGITRTENQKQLAEFENNQEFIEKLTQDKKQINKQLF